MTLSEQERLGLSMVSGLDLRMFRPAHVDSRVQREIGLRGVSDATALRGSLMVSPSAREQFRRSVAISVSGFFRDPDQFAVLQDALPSLAGRTRLGVWSAGCADGAELWSTAVVLERAGMLPGCWLLGSDLLEENIALAKAGMKPARHEGVTLPVSAQMRFEVRDIVAEGAPAGRWDLILCRNLAIYLAPEPRAALHRMLVDALAPGGLLLLGRSEWLTDPRAHGVERVADHLYRKR